MSIIPSLQRLLRMLLHHNILKASLSILAVFCLLVMCNKNLNNGNSTASCTCGTLIDIEFGPKVPGDNKLVTGQLQANCFAWAEFVALNWPTASGVSFGQPGDLSPVQWETYMTREVLLPPDGSAPPAWGGWKSPKAPAHMANFLAGHPEGTKLLYHQHKFNAQGFSVLDETGEAFPSNAPNWLGAQNNTNVWYEVLVNEDEYHYIVKNKFYNANNQYDFVANQKDTITLPSGNEFRTGALELKASWMEVKEPGNARWNRYKLSKAVVVDAQTGTPRATTVALVGLHILHKTASQPTWFWATFEHVDNVPDLTAPPDGYNFFNPNCKSQQVNVPAQCGKNKNKQDSTYTIGCTPNQSAPYYLCSGAGPVAMQVTREIPIDAQARMANKQVQSYLRQNFPESVWANYQLVNMIWSTTPQTPQGNTVPLGVKSMQPVIPVANTVAETFIQGTTCFGCHQYATIANTATSNNSNYASDFSFIFQFAGYPGKTTAEQ